MTNQLINKYKASRSIQEFIRFCIVGGICTILDASIFYIVRLFSSYQIALTCGYCLSLIVNYYLTIYWTFKKKASAKNALGVIGAHLFNLFIVRMGLMFLFVDCMNMDDKIAYLPTLLISMVTNFIIIKFVVNKFSTICIAAYVCLLTNSCSKRQDIDPNFYIYLCFGQSNMVGLNTPETQDSILNERFVNLASCNDIDRKLGVWRPAIPPLCRNRAGLSPADYFGHTMLQYLPENKKIGIISVAANGVAIDIFDKDRYQMYYDSIPEAWKKREIEAYGVNLYQRLVSLGKKAQKEGLIRGILLHQGETDATSDEWFIKVNKVYNDILNDLNLCKDSVPLLVGEAVSSDQNGAYQHVNYTIDRIHDYIPTAYPISARGCVPREDQLHFSPEGIRKLGTRYGIKMLQLMGYNVCEESDNILQIDAAPNEDEFPINVHIREIDKKLIITSPEKLSKISIYSFSGDQIITISSNSKQTVEIDYEPLINETQLVLKIPAITGNVVTKNITR